MVGFDKFNGLASHDISRKEFLRYVAIALLSLIGVASILQSLNGAVSNSAPKNTQSSNYSTSPYGR